MNSALEKPLITQDKKLDFWKEQAFYPYQTDILKRFHMYINLIASESVLF